MELQFTDWLTNLLGVQSLIGFGAAPAAEVLQAVTEPVKTNAHDCDSIFISSVPGFESVPVMTVRDNLAVIPDDWTNKGVGTNYLNAQTFSSLSACLNQVKASSFVAYDDDFFGFLGRQASLDTIHTFSGEEASRVHEAPVYLPHTNELLFADTSVIGWLYAINVDTSELRKITTQPALHNVNGGTLSGESIYLTTNGGTSPHIAKCSIPSSISSTITCMTLVNNYRLNHLNSPNDLIFTSRGHILFTDPDYGWAQSWPGITHPELPNTIYHFNTTSSALIALSNSDVLMPNGLALSPDENTLYVADSNSTSGKPIGIHPSSIRNVYAFDFDAHTPSLTNRRLVYVCEAGWPDGLRVTESGLLLVATMGGVDVVDPQSGRLSGKVSVGDDIIFNLEPVSRTSGIWILTGRKAIYKLTIAEKARKW